VATSKINKSMIDGAKPGERDAFIWDSDLPGFGLKVTPAGGRVYIYQYRIAAPGETARTTAKRYTIGKHGPLNPRSGPRACQGTRGAGDARDRPSPARA